MSQSDNSLAKEEILMMIQKFQEDQDKIKKLEESLRALQEAKPLSLEPEDGNDLKEECLMLIGSVKTLRDKIQEDKAEYEENESVYKEELLMILGKLTKVT